MKRYKLVLLLVVVSLGMILLSEKGIKRLKIYINQQQNEKSNVPEKNESQNDLKTVDIDFTIVIDPGHGGYDPGKIGMNGVVEKEINLSISIKLKELLEEKGFNIVMTRISDEALCDGDTYVKSEDMLNRVKIIEGVNADITVSIHQNSFTNSSTKGAQVFYYSGSEKSHQLAEQIQGAMRELIDDSNKRLAKENNTYYLLRKTTNPIVIVECGFLTNPEEAGLLADDAYQTKAAKAIFEGIIRYYESSTTISID